MTICEGRPALFRAVGLVLFAPLLLASPAPSRKLDPSSAILHVTASGECDLAAGVPVLGLCGERLVRAQTRMDKRLDENGPNTEFCNVQTDCDALFVLGGSLLDLGEGPAPRAAIHGVLMGKGVTVTLGKHSGLLRLDGRSHRLRWSASRSRAQMIQGPADDVELVWAGDLNRDGRPDLLVRVRWSGQELITAMASYKLLVSEPDGTLREAAKGRSDPNE